MDVNLSEIAHQSALKAMSEEQSLLLAQITRLETDNANLRIALERIKRELDTYEGKEEALYAIAVHVRFALKGDL